MSPVDKFYINLSKYKYQVENKNKSKRGRPRKRYYFNEITEKAIVAYNNESSNSKRNKIFVEWINKPLYKLAENIINTFKFPYMDGTIEDKKHEVVCFLLQKIDKYSPDKGKAFSYFSIVAKNYLIQTNNKAYAKAKIKISIQELKHDYTEDYLEHHNDFNIDGTFEEEKHKFIDDFLDDYEKEIENQFFLDRDIDIAYSIIALLRSRVINELSNKKAMYLMLREMNEDIKTQQITGVMNVIKKDYNEAYTEFLKIHHL